MSGARAAIGLGVVLVWSACFVVIKASQGDVTPLLYGALRALLGDIPLLAVAAATGRLMPPPRLWQWLALLGLTNTTLGLAGMFLSVGLAGAAIPGVLANSQALLVAPFAARLFGERLTGARMPGLLLGIAGIGHQAYRVVGRRSSERSRSSRPPSPSSGQLPCSGRLGSSRASCSSASSGPRARPGSGTSWSETAS